MSDAAKCLEETELLFYNALVRLEEEIGLTSAIAVNEGLSGEIGEIESLIAKARGDLWELDGNMDHEFKQLHDKVHKLLAAANSNDLRVLVHSTPTPEDDLVLDRIKSLESSIAMLDGHMACAAQNVENLRELYNYACAEESRQAAIVGAVNSRSPSFSFRSSSSYNFSSCGGTGHSSSFGSGSSSSSSCGGGSYRSSSSFGGGGFKTTGSF